MKRPMLYLLALGAGCLPYAVTAWADTAPPAAAEDEVEVVVSATRTETPVDQMASSVTVISAEQIKATQASLVVDVLREVPGLLITQSGGPGRQVDVFMRGAGPGHTLVLLDGVELNDPISSSRSYDLANLTVDGIARIEILRGPQSTLYGSDAMAGVINLITTRGRGAPQTEVTLSGGAFSTCDGRLFSSGRVRDWEYSFAGSRYTSDGFSAASEAQGNTENDGYANTTFSTRIGKQVNAQCAFEVIARYTKARADLDGWNYLSNSAGDDLAYVYDTEQTALRAQGRWQSASGQWEHLFGIATNFLEHTYDNQVGDGETGYADWSHYEGSSIKLDWQANGQADAHNLVTLGVETERDKGESISAYGSMSTCHVRTNGGYFQDQVTLTPAWLATVGLRWDDHETFGAQATYRLTSSYRLAAGGPRLKATYGTGFKAPTLYQLYDPSYGNPELQAEESAGWDVGVEQELLAGRAAVSATYFRTDFDDLIQWTLEDPDTFAGHYQNVSTATTHGVELAASYHPAPALRVDLSYTYTIAEGPGGEPLVRRPRHQYAADVTYRWTPQLQLNLRGVHLSARPDSTATLPAYTKFDLAGSYQVSPTTQAFLRIDNCFDADYEEVYGYGTSGRALTMGATYTF